MLKQAFVRWGIILGALSLLVRWLASPAWVEQYYSRGFYAMLRLFWDTLLASWFPIALVYILVPILLLRAARSVYRWGKRRGSYKWWSLIGGLLGFMGWVVTSFLILWGYNYGRIPVEERLGLKLENISLIELSTTIQKEGAVLARLRENMASLEDSTPLNFSVFPLDMETQLRDALERTLAYYSYPTVGAVRGRVLAPKGILLRFSTAGIYLPWTGEGHIDGGLIYLQRPYTMAHEMAHAYGFGDEGSCSFWAYLASYKLEDPVLQYAIRLGYWRSLAASWKRSEPGAYQTYRATLPPAIRADLDAINHNILAYPDIMPQFRDAAYDSYLKAQGISEGLANYSKVILLVENWKKQSIDFIGE